jgi:hypothetical protein
MASIADRIPALIEAAGRVLLSAPPPDRAR